MNFGKNMVLEYVTSECLKKNVVMKMAMRMLHLLSELRVMPRHVSEIDLELLWTYLAVEYGIYCSKEIFSSEDASKV